VTFRKVLIANRGEIAVRIVRACREMGVQAVAVYSDADRGALHVRLADEAYPIGPAPARDSYLRIDRLIDAARESSAEAVHPGYGFLSENAEFADACRRAGIVFVGPPASAIASMGDKLAARRLVEAAGVPIIPGTRTNLGDDDLLAAGTRLGFPVLIKAAAGGGGRGMRLASDFGELQNALPIARREARNAFGDGRVYLEKVIEGAHHVEIQVLADAHGHVIHLGERECSVQRRHQKLIEESPSPAVDDELRRRMGDVAVKAAAEVGYVNAGTVEFLLDRDRNFYFLEMNTRIQVEHPVTEMVTGIDMVKEQLRIAWGEPLGYGQDDVSARGWAIECRITAEDPFQGFLPVTGRIIRLHVPDGPGIRVDSGIDECLQVSLHYDPLLAKLIASGNTRQEALGRMRRALREYRIVGVQTSLPFHQWAMSDERFVQSTYDTPFLPDDFSLDPPGEEEGRTMAAIVATLVGHELRRGGQAAPAGCSEPGQPPEDLHGQAGAWKPSGEVGDSTSRWRLAGRWEALGG
jgi:acetyl-CoA carboxylase biotin carboxylase subunit